MVAHDAGDVIVQQAGEIISMVRLGPVTKHDGDGGQDLHGDAMSIAVLEARAGCQQFSSTSRKSLPSIIMRAQPGPVCSISTKPPQP